MIQYTTPKTVLTVSGIDLTNYTVYVTFSQGNNKLTIENPEVTVDGENTVISVTLTQEQTGSFDYSLPCRVQVNWIDSDGTRNATMVKKTAVFENLLSEVIAHD